MSTIELSRVEGKCTKQRQPNLWKILRKRRVQVKIEQEKKVIRMMILNI